jgi:hypothetical protein
VKLGAVEIALTTHAAPRVSAVSDTGDRRCLCAHLLARQPTSLTRLLTREVSVKLGAVEIALTTHAAPRVSVVSDTRDRRCLCAHLLARQPISLTLAYSRGEVAAVLKRPLVLVGPGLLMCEVWAILQRQPVHSSCSCRAATSCMTLEQLRATATVDGEGTRVALPSRHARSTGLVGQEPSQRWGSLFPQNAWESALPAACRPPQTGPPITPGPVLCLFLSTPLLQSKS